MSLMKWMELPRPKLSLQEVVPHFVLPSDELDNVDTWDYKQRKNLVIIFHHGFGCPSCRKKIAEVAQDYERIQELNAEVLAISNDSPKKAREFAEKANVTFPLLSDTKGITEKYSYEDEARGAPAPSVFITDRFGGLYYQKIGWEADDLPTVEEITDWSYLIEIQCPECSIY